MHKNTKQPSRFRNEAEERQFWESHDSSPYVDWNKAERVRLINLKPSAQLAPFRVIPAQAGTHEHGLSPTRRRLR
jgi:hypothetical protein